MKPSGRWAASRLSSSARERFGSKRRQTIAAKHYYRPSKPDLVKTELLQKLPDITLVTIDDPLFGGWAKAQPTHFGDGGVFDQIYKPGN